MLQPISKALAVLAGIVPLAVLAAGGTVAPSAQPAGTKAPAIATPAPATPAVDPKIAADVALLTGLQRDIDTQGAKVNLLNLQVKAQDLEKKLGTGGDTGGSPQLVGIYGTTGRMTAEFAVGDEVLQAKPGDYVNPQWRLERILSNGVVLRNGKHTRTVLFGRHDAPREAAASPMPMPGPVYPGGAGPEPNTMVYPAPQPGMAPGPGAH